jgi:dihydrodipicolinate synthase/N-acetylneuraminate lyase
VAFDEEPPAAGASMLLVVEAPITRADIPGLCARVCRLLEASDAPLVVFDVAAFADPDAVVVDALARLQIGAGRLGKTIELRHASARLRALLTMMGLGGVMTFADG